MKTIKINKEELINEIISHGPNKNLRLKIDPTSGKWGVYENDNSLTYTEIEGIKIFWDYIDLTSEFDCWSEGVEKKDLKDYGQTREEWEQDNFDTWINNSIEEFIDTINLESFIEHENTQGKIIYELI